ncbi:MAG: hypothetical protein K8S18_22220 [Desulfobacula sp.]|nr:hypothetical protein [Desulfobacula sp.]
MSIVIALAVKNEFTIIASDTRAVNRKGVDDNCEKIFILRKNIYLGMTGIKEDGLRYLSRINGNQRLAHLNTKDYLSWIDKDFRQQSFEKLAIIITGKDENREFFIQSQVKTCQADQYPISEDSFIPVVDCHTELRIIA